MNSADKNELTIKDVVIPKIVVEILARKIKEKQDAQKKKEAS